MVRKFSSKFFNALVLVLVLTLAVPWAAFADELVLNTDGDTVFAENTDKTLAFGTVCKGVSTKSATLAIERSNNLSNHPEKIFANAANVDLSVVSVSHTALSVTLPSGANGDVTTDANWIDQAEKAITADRVEVPVKLDTTNLTNGSEFDGTIKFKATGPAADGTTTLNREVTLKVAATVGSTSCEQATTTSLSSSKNPSKYAESVTFTAIVSPSAATGDVEFFNGAVSLGKKALSSGSTSLSTSNLAVSTHSITAKYLGATGYGSSTSSAVSQVVDKATPSINWSNPADITYGTELDSMQLNANSPVAGSFTYTPAAGTKLSAGAAQNLKVDFTPTDTANYNTASKTVQINVNKAAATVQLNGDRSRTYNGDAHSLTASTTPADLDVVVTYNGSATAPTNAGSYNVVGTITSPNYSGSTSATLVIAKANASISWGAIGSKTYGDAAFSLSATATSGAAVSFSKVSGPCSVSGSEVTITGAGDCVVSASAPATNNYEAASDDKTISIAKAQAAVSLSNLSKTYNGSAQYATVGTTPSGLNVDIVYKDANGNTVTAPANAGSYDVTVTVNEANYKGSASGTLEIAKASQTISFGPLATPKTFGDADFAVSATGGASGNPVTFHADWECTVVNGQVHITGAGSCSITASQAGNDNYLAAQPVNRQFAILKAQATLSLSGLTHTYDGTAKAATASTSPAGLTVEFAYSQNGNAVAAPTNAGSYDVVGTINNANYQGSTTGNLVIAKATPVVTWDNPTAITYGTALSGTQLNASPDVAGGFAYTPAAGTQLSAGTHTLSVDFTPTDTANYNGVSKTVSLTVNKATAAVTLGNLSGHIYDGSAKAATATTNPAGLNVAITYDGSTTAPSAVGSYSVVATVNDANYQGSAKGTLTIGAWTLKGFYSPVDMGGVVNTVKGGSTVPMKFEVFKGSTELKDVANIKSTMTQQIDCGTLSGVADEIEVTTTGSTSLRFDSTSDQFIFNWKTPTGTACYAAKVTTQDGSTLVAYFKTR